MSDIYQKAQEEAEQELGKLIDQRGEINCRIEALIDVIEGLKLIRGESAKSFQMAIRGLGMTDALRRILQYSNSPMSPTEIRSALIAARFDVSGQSNVLATIHSVLKRLEEAGELKSEKRSDGSTEYFWLSPLRRALVKEASNYFEAMVNSAKPSTGLESILDLAARQHQAVETLLGRPTKPSGSSLAPAAPDLSDLKKEKK